MCLNSAYVELSRKSKRPQKFPLEIAQGPSLRSIASGTPQAYILSARAVFYPAGPPRNGHFVFRTRVHCLCASLAFGMAGWRRSGDGRLSSRVGQGQKRPPHEVTGYSISFQEAEVQFKDCRSSLNSASPVMLIIYFNGIHFSKF